MNHQNNAVVMITGAKGGLGSFVTEACLAAGSNVIGVSRSIKPADFENDRFTAMPAELSSGGAAQSVADAAIQRFSRIDALVHVLGGFEGGQRIEDTSAETLDRMMEINFRSAFFILQAVVPHMRKAGKGAIVAIGSRAALEPVPTLSAYSASKAALISLIRTTAAENKDSGITANVVLPGTMDTRANRTAMPNADFSKWVQPSDVASLIQWLISGAGSAVNGAVLPIYGGES
jgi:NAD(P)-dependent dehydrogenase (short-subunit alcohol dehydrogenase family)